MIDEIAFIKTSLFEAVAPTVAGVGGSIVALSTPNGASGVFHEIWTSPDEDGWHKVRVTLEDCLHYQEEDIAAQRARLGERRFAQEFGGEFLQPAGAVFQDLDDLFGAFTAVESEVERDNFMPLSGFH